MKSGDSMMDAFNQACADVANAAARLREMRPAALHFTGPQKLTIAVLRKTIREASLVCAALERMGHEAHPFGWSDPEKNASMGYCKFDLVDSGGAALGDRDAHDLVLEDLLHPRHRSRSVFVERNPLDPGTTPIPPPPPTHSPLPPPRDDFALTLEEQTCILDALQRAKAEPEASDSAVVLGAVGKAGSFVVEAGNEPKPKPKIDPPRQPGQSVKSWIVTRYAPNVIRIERSDPFASPHSGAAVCLSDHDAAHVARALRGEIDIERVIALVSPTRFGLRIGRTYYDVHEPKALAARIEEALGETHERNTADLQSPKPANPVKRDADLGDPVRITKFGQLWSLRVPSEADSYGVVVAREVGGDGVLRWKVCPIAEENDIASWCEGVERISRSEWLNLLGARDVQERAQREALAKPQPQPKTVQAGDTVRIKGTPHSDDRVFAVGRVENTGNGLEALLVWNDGMDGVGTKAVPVAALEVVGTKCEPTPSEPENEPEGKDEGEGKGEGVDVGSMVGRAVRLRGALGGQGRHVIAARSQHTEVDGVWCEAVVVASETPYGLVTSLVPVAALEVV